ncbi:MAG: rhodanese-like domain-containing protein [Gammaproteobacteria bacterium]|nr:MAG: rhodanese-like domain-containing protein [Gammaproteobacteria bacterium]
MVMKNIFLIAVIGIFMSMSSVAWSYDMEMAKSYEKLFSTVTGGKAGKELRLVKPEDFIKGIKEGKAIIAIDVRTSAEMEVFGLTLPGSLAIPVNQLFKQENLDRIPTDKPVMIVCQSGGRALAVGTSLRHIGFKNVYILKGGFKSLVGYFGPKQAYQKIKPAEAKK